MRQLFWRNFFSLLLVFVAVAEWACVAWLATHLGGQRLPSWLHVAAPAAIYLLNRLVVVRRPNASARPHAMRRFYTGVAFTCVFGFVLLLILGATWAVARAGFEVAGLAGLSPPIDSLGRTMRAAATGGLVTVAAAMAYGYGFGQRRLWINRFDLQVAGLDQRLDGRTIVQISDIHLGTYMPAERVERYVACVNALDPDLVAITGDITDGLAHAPETFRALGGIRGRYGVLAVLGNHDVYTGADEVEAALRTYTDFTVLRDRAATVEIDGGRLAVVGLNDRGLDWARGLPECEVLERLWAEMPEDLPSLVLTHRPDLFGHAARLGATLVLAGHTHGGQLAIPWRRGRAATLARFMTRFPRGTYRHGDSVLHVNLGLGVTGQPVRVGTPREITVITLRSRPLAS